MKFLKKLSRLFKGKKTAQNHPHDLELEQNNNQSALVEIELTQD